MRDTTVITHKKPDLQRELGAKADTELASELARKMSSSWQEAKELPRKPVLLLLGGFQGSGKTSVLERLRRYHFFLVISPDEIRHELFKKIPFSEVFEHTVCAARNKLVIKAAGTGHHVAIDENAVPMRIDIYRSLLKENAPHAYRVLTAYLDASVEMLISRVASRPRLRGKYKGTVEELKAYMHAYGRPNLDRYDVLFNTEEISIEHIARRLTRRIDEINNLT